VACHPNNALTKAALIAEAVELNLLATRMRSKVTRNTNLVSFVVQSFNPLILLCYTTILFGIFHPQNGPNHKTILFKSGNGARLKN
jgi:hypothetical protein